MASFKIWLSAARPRTLPLSLSGIITGTALANLNGHADILIFVLCLVVTIGFQVTSNFANDYGDGVKGTDGADRVGPKRALQSGALSPAQLKGAIVLTAVVSLVLAIVLLAYVFGADQLPYFLAFLVLGGLSIWAAIKYTVGKSAYGYRGLGDVFVFLFFGLLAVLGTKFLYIPQLQITDILPAVGIGLLCVGVLNLNNLRDVNADAKHGKNTLVVKMGFKNGKRYHLGLLVVAFLCFLGFSLLKLAAWQWLYLLPFGVVFIHLQRVLKTQDPVKLDPELKKLALATFLLSIGFYVAVNNFL